MPRRSSSPQRIPAPAAPQDAPEPLEEEQQADEAGGDEGPEERWEEVEESEALEEWSEDEADEEIAAVVAVVEELESGEVEEGAEPPHAEEEPGVPPGEDGPEEPAPPALAEMVALGHVSPRKKDELAPGTVLDLGACGKVTVERRLGRGGMAEVYVGLLETAKECRQRVAVKRVRRGIREAMAGRLVDEARVHACVAHANVARLHGFYDVGDSRFILMEYVEGRSLRELFKLARSRARTLSQAAVCWLLAELADALHAVHNATDVEGHPLHVVHRDVTPENIIVDATGRPRLVDFGVAFSTLPDRVQTGTSNSTWLGKIPYLAPEQVRGDRVDARTDLFALGCILVEALTGETPFGDDDIATTYRINQVTPAWVDYVTKDVAPPVKAICHKLLAHDPDQRYTHGHEVAQALRACLDEPFSEAQLKAEIARLEGLLDTTYMDSDLVLVPPEEENPQQQPPSPPPPEAAPVAPPSPRRYQSPWVLAGVMLLACASTAGLTWFAARSGQPGAAAAMVPVTTPPVLPAVLPAPAPPEPAREKLQAPEVQNVEGSSNVNANPPPTTPDEATSPPVEVEKNSKKKLTPAQCFAKAVMTGSLSVLLGCHGSLRAGTCPEPTSKSVPGQHRRVKPVGMVRFPTGAEFLTPRSCTRGRDCPPLEGPVMLEIQSGEHQWSAWKLTGTARILWGDETTTWDGKPIKAVGRWVVLLSELRESDVLAELKARKWPVCGTLIGEDGKEGIPLLSETLQADWGPDSFVQLFY